MTAMSIQEELGLRAPAAAGAAWWAPEDGSFAAAVRDVVRAVLALTAWAALVAAPGLADMAITALLDGGVR